MSKVNNKKIRKMFGKEMKKLFAVSYVKYWKRDEEIHCRVICKILEKR